MTSWPLSLSGVPSASAVIMGLPPGLSVIERASKRGSAARAWAMSSTRLPPRSAKVPRDVTNSTQVMKRSVSSSRWRRVAVCCMACSDGGRGQLAGHGFELAALDEEFKKVGGRL